MSRIERKNRTDILIKPPSGLLVAIDNAFKVFWRVNDEELDYICDNATNEELSIITKFGGKYSEMKKLILIVDELLNRMYIPHPNVKKTN